MLTHKPPAMLPDIKRMDSKDLVTYYSKLNAEVNKRLLSGDTWETVKEDIHNLTEMTKELTARKISFNPNISAQADPSIESTETE